MVVDFRASEVLKFGKILMSRDRVISAVILGCALEPVYNRRSTVTAYDSNYRRATCVKV